MKIGIIGINSVKDNDHFSLINNALKKDLYGLFSPHTEEITPISKSFNKNLYNSANELIEKVDAIYFAGALKPNYDFALDALKKSCHIFIEDISGLTIQEIKHLYKVAFEARTRIQLKLSKSFSSVYLEVVDYLTNPKLIEINKCYSSLIRNTDYFEEIFNNLNIANQHINSGIKKVSGVTLPVEINHFSLIHVRVDYDNGAVLNMKFNNISTNESNNILFYQSERTVDIDFIRNFAIKYKFDNGQIIRREFAGKNEDTLKAEMLGFINSCQNFDLQNTSEAPPIIRTIQTSQEIMDHLLSTGN